MRVYVRNVHIQGLRRRSQCLWTRQAVIPARSEHDKTRAQSELRMSDKLSGFRHREEISKAKRRAEPLNRGPGIGVSQDWEYRLHR